MDNPQQLERRLDQLQARGVTIIDPRQTYVAPDVALARIHAGAVLHPGARVHGSRALLAPGAQLGVEGPATLVDAVLGPGAAVASGYVQGAVLLRGAQLGFGAHVRPGTLLEEQASTAHCVGLKHTILLSFVTLGSLINFCDVLMAGGRSRRDHSEVGSGYIHFNYTPWGARGDKATPSLVGDVPRGVLLRSRRIFLGGSGGMIGPRRVGYGAIAGAGQVLRRDIAEGYLSVQPSRKSERALRAGYLDPASSRRERNVRYLANLMALRAWYRQVRLARAGDALELEILQAALQNLDKAVSERVQRVNAFLEERAATPVDPAIAMMPAPPCPMTLTSTGDHVAWVQSLPDGDADALSSWLQAYVDQVCARGAAPAGA